MSTISIKTTVLSYSKKLVKKQKRHFQKPKKHKLIIDVDDTTIQTYTKNNKDIDVFDDYDIGAVFIKSELDLSMILD